MSLNHNFSLDIAKRMLKTFVHINFWIRVFWQRRGRSNSLQMSRLLVCKFETSNFWLFPFAEQESTLLGKVGFFKSGHFTGQSDNFSTVDTLPGKVEFWSENGIFGHIFNFCFSFQIWPRTYLNIYIWSLGAQKRARFNYFIFELIENVIVQNAILLNCLSNCLLNCLL